MFGSSLVTKYYLYYMIGYLLSERNILNSKIISKTTYIIGGVIIFTILGYFWKRTGFIFSIFNEISYNKFINLPYRVITALVGIFTTIIIFMSINKSNYITTYIGQRTLAIYAIHFYIIELLSTIGNYNTYTIIVTLPMTIFASLLLEYILSLNRYTSLFLLGKNK